MISDLPSAAVPALPVYQPPKERAEAPLPKGLEVTKMPNTMNKMISKMLMPKLKAKLPNKMKTAIRPKTKSRTNPKTKIKKGIQIV